MLFGLRKILKVNKYLEENNYLVVPNFLSAKKAKSLALKFKEYCHKNNIKGDDQAPNSSGEYNFSLFLELLCEKVKKVSNLVEEKVLPTYSYARVYRRNDELTKHRDRDACELSLTINLFQNKEWPIYISKPNGETAKVTLQPGDAMIYLGCVAPHWRDVLLEEEYVQVFLHYVFSRGSRANHVFDIKRREKEIIRSHSNNHGATSDARLDLRSYIFYQENIIPKEFCQKIINEFKEQDEWTQTRVGGNGGEEVPEIRGAKAIRISSPESIAKNPEVRKNIDQNLYLYVSDALVNYANRYGNISIQEDSGYELLRYNVGEGYKQHTDNFYDFPRAVSCSICLTDDYEGGEFTFFDGLMTFKQKAGSVLMFPSSFQYPHQVNKVTSGTRYAIITWFR